jgi:beta-1,4-mannosyl-glycoprotein beta-1,4-N-acetylglucosaminyltransferase
MIWDCFTYSGEEHLLELRLHTLKDVVDRFVIAEATRTFTGIDKPLKFDAGRFPEFASRIHYVRVDDLDPRPVSVWDNEYRQRDALVRGLADCAREDWVMLSDVDEIPRPSALLQFRPERYLSAVLSQRMYYYAFNNLMVSSDNAKDIPWRVVRVTTAGRLHGWFGSMQSMRGFRASGPLRSFKRQWNKLRTQIIEDGGWHFSYLMTPQQILAKLQAFSHQELNTQEFANEERIREALRNRTDLFGGSRHFEVVPLDDTFPEPLLRQRERFKQWIF